MDSTRRSAKSGQVTLGNWYSTAGDCCAAGLLVGRLLTRAVLYRSCVARFRSGIRGGWGEWRVQFSTGVFDGGACILNAQVVSSQRFSVPFDVQEITMAGTLVENATR